MGTDLREGVLLALGGNAIVKVGEKGTIPEQWSRADASTGEIAELWARHRWPLLITHGNGPQIGRILLRSELAAKEIDPLPLDVAVADSEAGMGYMVQQLLWNHIARLGRDANIVTLVTRVQVDENDPGFRSPTKPIGLFYSVEEATDLMQVRGWVMKEDAGRGWRRVVPSPAPKRVIETESIRALLERSAIVIAAGGGGIPVIKKEDGSLHGIECVIDKDLTAAMLATSLGFQRLVILTGVPTVCLDWGKPTQREVTSLTAREAEEHLKAGQFPAGSMGPKMAAAIEFARGGGTTIITQPGDLEAALAGERGTRVVPD
jgi:carbamate kinase